MQANKIWWNKAVDHHINSPFYDVKGFLENPKKLTLGQLEISEVGDVIDRNLLHLQCHFGLDTLSWQRLGAKCTGVDFSENAIEAARSLNIKSGLRAKFICSDIYEISHQLNNSFDIVFSSYGVLCWIKDIDMYAKMIASKLKSGGFYYLAEIHPFFNLFDIGCDKIIRKYSPSEQVSEIVGSYMENIKKFKSKQISFSYTLSNFINSLIKAKLKIEFFNEFNYSTYLFHNKLKKFDYGLAFDENQKIPLVFSIKAYKE